MLNVQLDGLVCSYAGDTSDLCYVWKSGSSLAYVSTWDGTILAFNLFDGSKLSFNKSSPISRIEVDPACENNCWAGDIEGCVEFINIISKKSESVYKHTSTVSGLSSMPHLNAIVSSSWDGSVCLHSYCKEFCGISKVPDPVIALDSNQNYVLVSTSKRYLYLFDIRNFSNAVKERVIPLAHQIRSLKLLSDNSGN